MSFVFASRDLWYNLLTNMKVMKKYLNIFLKLYSSILNSLLPQCSLFSIEYQYFQLEVCNIRSIDLQVVDVVAYLEIIWPL
jgi:hypothetical protein